MSSSYDKMILSGFGNEDANGTYWYVYDFNGYPAYQKGNFYLFYYPAWMPWSNSAGYYVIDKKQIQGSIPVFKPIYRISGTDPESTGWKSLQDVTSGENTVGSVLFNEDSSSSSIDSSSSSSTSNSSSSSSSTSNSSSSSSSSTSNSSSSSSSSTSNSSSSSSSTSNSSSSSSSSTSNSSSSSSSTSNSSSSSSSSTSDSSSSSSSSTSNSSSSSSSSTSESSSSSSSVSESSSSSSSSGVLGCRDHYLASGFTTSSYNGTYNYTGSTLNSEAIYSNGTWYVWYDSAYGYWAMSNNAGDPPNQWVSSKDVSGGCPDGTWENESGTIS